MLSFRVTNPDFYTNYLNARIIVDLGAGKGPEVVATPVGWDSALTPSGLLLCN